MLGTEIKACFYLPHLLEDSNSVRGIPDKITNICLKLFKDKPSNVFLVNRTFNLGG